MEDNRVVEERETLEMEEVRAVNQPPIVENTAIPNVGKTKNGQGMILSIVLLVAVAVLYVLFFTKKEKATAFVAAAGENSGLVLTVNQDSILEHFVLVNLFKKDLETESAKYQAELEKKSAVFEEKYRNYMINVQNQVLTQTQMQNTEKLLIDEKTNLENLSAKYTEIMTKKKMSVDREILDSITNAVKRVNAASYNADYVFAAAEGSAIIYSKPAYDMTKQVIEELNNAYNKTHKK
jgi:Skp family chaperone for outer membrane proteins